MEWATSPSRKFARAWAPLALILEGDAGRVAWMPAHCTEEQAYSRRLSDGTPLTVTDITSNAVVDGLAKKVARQQKLPQWQCDMVRDEGRKVAEAAMWIGRATAFANRFPNPNWNEGLGHKLKFLRDSQGTRRQGKGSAPAKRRSPLSVISPSVATTAAVSAADVPLLIAAEPSGPAKRMVAATSHDIARTKRHVAAKAAAAQREQLADSARVARWVSEGELRPAESPAAVEKMAALRERLRARASK